ncbi:MAG TPA: tetratricopeptide repeat protein [Candidatus Dormibacteraeota bacterium]
MKTPTGEHVKPRSQYVEDAIRLAMESKWEEAVEINQLTLENFGPDDQAYNRLGKALTELGRLEEARDQYEKSLKLNPFNTVAKKNRSKLEVLIQHKDDIKTGVTRVDLNLFVEEMGKTVITQLEAVDDPKVCDKVVPGDIAELAVTGDAITVTTLRGIKLGQLEAKMARRLIKFMQGGNRYQSGVTGCENGQIRVIVRETYQDPKFAGKPSFPMRQKREVAFRPYARESLIQRDAEFPTDDDEEDLVQAGVELDIEEDEGMHEVDEETETVDFAEESDSGSDDDDDEDSR